MKELETKMEKCEEKRDGAIEQREETGNRDQGEGMWVTQMVEDTLQDLTIHSDSFEDEDEDRAICPICSLVYPDDGRFWIACDGCNDWFDLKCTDVEDEERVPDTYYCLNRHV